MTLIPNHDDTNQTPGQMKPPITGQSVFLVLLFSVLLFFGMSVFFFILAASQVLLDSYDGVPQVDVLKQDQEKILDGVMEMISAGVSHWTPMMQFTWMLNQAIIILPAFIFLRMRRLSTVIHFRLKSVPIPFIIYAVIIGIAIAVLGDELSRLVDLVKPIPDYLSESLKRILTFKSATDFFTLLLTICVVAPIVEEGLFRGFVQRWFEQNRGVTSGVLATSAIFALVHANLYFLIPILLMAVIMGAMAWRVESIWPPVVVHAVNNAAGLFASNTLGTEDPVWYGFGKHVAPWWLALALILLIWSLRRYFRLAEVLRLGGHGPRGDSGSNLNLLA